MRRGRRNARTQPVTGAALFNVFGTPLSMDV